MRISQVEFRQLVSFGEYENMSVGATASVGFDELPETVLAELRAWVCDRLADCKAMEARTRQEMAAASDAQAEIRNYDDLVRQAKERWLKAEEFLKLHGVTPPDELPF